MAEKEEAAAEVAPKKKGKLMLFIIIGVVVLALVGGAGAFFLLKKKANTEGEDGEETPAAETKKSEKHEPPVFVKLEPFTVRLQSEGQDSYLQATPELRVKDAATGEMVKEYTPEIRHKSLLVIAAKTPSEVTTPQGVEKLATELRVTMNKILNPNPPKRKGKSAQPEGDGDSPSPDDPVQAVLFTSFIVQ